MGKTTIEWTEFSTNPIRARNPKTNKTGHFCVKISAGCANCYAAHFNLQHRGGIGTGLDFIPQNESKLDIFLDQAELEGIIRRKKSTTYFWCNMSDLFGPWVKDEWLDQCFAAMIRTPWHIHQILTKRPERMRAYLESRIKVPPNVWVGVSVENEAAALERVPLLLTTPAAIRFLSCEPLLGRLDLSRWLQTGRCQSRGGGPLAFRCGLEAGHEGNHSALMETKAPWFGLRELHWVIVGGESGANARPCEPAWVAEIVAQCQAAKVPVFVKQLGSQWAAGGRGAPPAGLRRDRKGGNPDLWPSHLRVRQFPTARPRLTSY